MRLVFPNSQRSVWVGFWLLFWAGCLAVSGGDRDWPQFRGMERGGVSQEKGLLDGWGESGPDMIWKKPLGSGFSGMTIAGGRLFTLFGGESDGGRREFAGSFDLETGSERWRVELGEEFEDEFGNGPRATPTHEAGMVYALGSRGRLLALDADSGAVRWEKDFPADFGSEVPRWGFSSSPLVEGDLLLVEIGGGEGKAFAALDKSDGAVRWTTQDGEAGYNSPISATIDGRRQIIFLRGQSFVGLDVKGREIWSHELGPSVAVPLYVGPARLFVSSSNDDGGRMLRIGQDGERASVEELWRNRLMRNHFSSSVLYGDHIYGFDIATLRCLAVSDGGQAWAKRGFGKGSLIAADGKLLILSDRGQLVLAKASPEKFEEMGRFQALKGKCWTAPSLAGGRVFLRNHREMACFDLRKAATDAPKGLE